jgi:mRNA interferase RelE/StbE
VSWLVGVGASARKSLDRIPTADRRRIEAAIAAMQIDPLSGDVVKLAGTEAFRRRIGNYRIIFDVDFKTRSVRIFDVLRRSTTTYRR